MISMVKIGSGEDAWRYFQSTVADEATVGAALDYYVDDGTPAGRWLGSGLADLGLPEGHFATPAELSNVFGGGKHPLTGELLARRYTVAPTLDERVSARIEALDEDLDDASRAAATSRIVAEETARAPAASVAGFELVFNPPKSVSVLWALAGPDDRSEIRAAHHQAMQETIAILERDALRTRVGSGGVAQIEVTGMVAAAFDHWDSREGDPHLHTHLLIANRVRAADGRWRTIDSRHALAPHLVTLSETYDAALMDALSNRLGLAWTERSVLRDPLGYEAFIEANELTDSQESRALFADASGVEPRNRKWEIAEVGLPLIEEFSQRATRISEAKDDLVAAFRARVGREPTRFEIWRMRQTATRSTRTAKVPHALDELTVGWMSRAAQVVEDPKSFAERILVRGQIRRYARATWGRRADDLARSVDREHIVHGVLASLGRSRSTWTRSNALAEIHRALKPVTFATAIERDDVSWQLLDQVVDAAVPVTPRNPLHAPRQFRQADGSSVFAPKARELFTTQSILDAEGRLLAAAEHVTDLGLDHSDVERALAATAAGARPLGEDQRAAVHAIAESGRALDVLVGPAGAGKTTALSALRRVWERRHGAESVIGLAPSAVAAQVLGDALGIPTENTAMWITRSTAGRPAFQMRPGQLVIVDEAGMSGTIALDELRAQAERAGTKLLLVGDSAQLGAVGAGGAFSLIVERRGELAPQLNEVRRFSNEWERTASVLLRVGDVAAIDAYARHDRVLGGPQDAMLADALAAWKRDTETGIDTLLIASDNATVRALNQDAQEWLASAGRLGAPSAPIAEGMRAHVGDRIVTRENDRMLRDSRGNWVRNGQEWRVERVRADGELVVVGRDGARVTLPVAYARANVQLAYASTAHRAQGRTVDAAHVLVDESTSREVFYVAMTRGRDANRAYVSVDRVGDEDAQRPLERGWRDVLETALRTTGASVSATRAMQDEFERSRSIRQLTLEYETLAAHVARERYGAILESELGPAIHADLSDDGGYDALISLMRTADSRGVAVGGLVRMTYNERSLHSAVDAASVLHHRLTNCLAVAADAASNGERRIVGIVDAIESPDPDIQRALDDREAAILCRAELVLDSAHERGEAWAAGLSASGRSTEKESALIVAAYRDRWQIAGTNPLGASQPTSTRQRRDIARAQSALASRVRSDETAPTQMNSATAHRVAVKGLESRTLSPRR